MRDWLRVIGVTVVVACVAVGYVVFIAVGVLCVQASSLIGRLLRR